MMAKSLKPYLLCAQWLILKLTCDSRNHVRALLPTAFRLSSKHAERRVYGSRLGSDSSKLASASSSLAATSESSSNDGTEEKNSEADQLKDDLLSLAKRTQRGFRAGKSDREKARSLIYALNRFNPTADPAKAYYPDIDETSTDDVTLAGKWTLVYTDAPDITSLDSNVWAELGQIGQECVPPNIKNVIEWKRPSWAENLPLSGPKNARVLQKVVVEASASPERPTLVSLNLKGLQAETDANESIEGNFLDAIKARGLVAGTLSTNPINLQGPLKTPFGEFEILYLDEHMRIVRTYQSCVAVNVRTDDEWF